MKQKKETPEINPVMRFTLEEELKIIDFMVRTEDYLAKRFIFINKNFDYNGCFFKSNDNLRIETAISANSHRKLPYNPVIEGRLLHLGLKFIQLNIDNFNFFDDMKFLSTRVKLNMLETSFPACQIILYGLLETNNWPKPLYNFPETGFPATTTMFFGTLETQKVGHIRMKDMEKFTSPWAIDYADEVKFENTVRKVGEALGSDLKLQALYTMLVMITPCHKQV